MGFIAGYGPRSIVTNNQTYCSMPILVVPLEIWLSDAKPGKLWSDAEGKDKSATLRHHFVSASCIHFQGDQLSLTIKYISNTW
jgi:hypothetical protein